MPTRSLTSWDATRKLPATPYTPSTRTDFRRHFGKAPNVRIPFTGPSRVPNRPEALREVLHHKPRKFGKHTRSVWTLDLAAEVSFEEGLTKEQITGEIVRATLARLGVRWERAKRWITSPDPEYQRKKG